MKELSNKELELIVKCLGWRLEYLEETPDLGPKGEGAEISSLINSLGFVTYSDPESGEIGVIAE